MYIILMVFLMAGCNSTKQTVDTAEPDPALFQHWTHSYEDDTSDITVYRPASYAFPPSRGREGFEIREDGVYIRHAIGRADYPEQFEGSWEMSEEDELIVTLPKQPPFELKILSVTEEMLKIQK